LSLEQVDELYENVDKAWKSRGFVPKLRYANVEKMGPDGRPGSTAPLDGAVQSKSAVEASAAHVEDMA